MLDFPAAPTNGQLFNGTNGVTYQWQAGMGLWESMGSAPTDNFNVRDFGAKGDGVTDDTLALQAAIDACNAAGGGTVNCAGGRWLIDSADLNILDSVFLKGDWENLGQNQIIGGAFTYYTANSTLIVNPAFTLRLYGSNNGIRGLCIMRKGIAKQSTLRAAVDQINGFAGIGVTIGRPGVAASGNDSYLGHLFIGGFGTGIATAGQTNGRTHIEWIQGDNTNGIALTQSYDMQHLSHVHFWPFLNSSVASGAYAVSGAVNNGSGLIRLTIAASVLVTGDRVTVIDVGGVPNAIGRFVATVINSTTIDLQGSTFAGTYTSGGTVYLSTYYRAGSGIGLSNVVDWGQMDSCFCYGYQTGISLSNSNYTTLVNCGTDHIAVESDPTTVGIHVTGTCKSAALVGCKTAAAGTGLKIEISAPAENNVVVTNHRAWGLVTYALQVITGTASFVNCDVQTSETIRVEAAATAVSFIGGDLTGVPAISYATGAPQVQFIGVAGGPIHQLTTRGGSGSRTIMRKVLDNQTAAASDTIAESAYVNDAAGTLTEISRVSHRAISVAAGAVSSSIFWGVRTAGTFADLVLLNGSGIGPITHNAIACGSTSAYWSNTYTTLATVRTELTTQANVGIGVGAATQHFVKASTTSNFGLFYGTGAPAFAAAKGSLYTNTTATTTTTRLYVNTDGASTWTNLTTAA